MLFHVRLALALPTLLVSLVSGLASAPVVFPGKQWAEAVPETQGLDSARLKAAIQTLERNVGTDGVRELVIVQNGVMIWRGTEIDKVHGVWSATKSFTSTVLGLLVDDDKCDLESRAAKFLPALGRTYGEVTLKHFGTMTSGYRAVGDEPQGTYLHGPSTTPFRPDDQPLFAPGTHYAYWDSAMNQFANVLTRIAGEPIEELFRRRIAEPIGMNPKAWDWGDFGKVDGITVNGGSGNMDRHIRISARELARFGHLWLNNGAWNGRQLLSRNYVKMAITVHVMDQTPLGGPARAIDGRGVYGLNWWVNGTGPDGKRKWPSAPPGTFAASGFNNNKCFVVPEWSMVIVRAGLDGNVTDSVWDDFLRDVGTAILPKRRDERPNKSRLRQPSPDISVLSFSIKAS